MEDNVNQILGVDNNEPTKQEVKETNPFNSEEKVLRIIANVILVVGVLTGIICLGELTMIDVGSGWIKSTVFNAAGFAASVSIILTTLALWAGLRLIASVSRTLRNIDSKMK